MRIFRPQAHYGRLWSGDVLVFSPGHIPTVDFYIRSRLLDGGAVAFRHIDTGNFCSDGLEAPSGAFVVIVRHAGSESLRFIAAHRDRWSGVAYLIDDDIPAAWRCSDVPLDYGLWTTGRYLRISRLLPRVCDRVWVSTAALQARYPGTRVVPPLPFEPVREPAPPGIRRWAYHGTRVHGRELRWLVPIVEAVQGAVPEAEFEVFGNRGVERLFSHIPRVTVLAPRPWPEYIAHCHNSNLAVGLAPMLPGRFNAVRSHTKAFDIARCGAVGLFSDREPYATALRDSGAILLPDHRDGWVAEAIRLLRDDSLRFAFFRRMREWQDLRGTEGDIGDLIREREAI